MTVNQCFNLFDRTYIISSRDRQELNTSSVREVVGKMKDSGLLKIVRDSKTIDALYLELTSKGIEKYEALRKHFKPKM